MSDSYPEPRDRYMGDEIALVEVIDRVIDKGVVLTGNITLSVADIDLVHLGLQLWISNDETARRMIRRLG